MMTTLRRLAMLVAAVAAMACAAPAAASAAPLIEFQPHHYPTNFKPGGTGRVEAVISNQGDTDTSGPLTVKIELPAGMTVTEFGFSPFECAGTTTVTCTTEQVIPANPAEAFGQAISLMVEIDPGISGRQEVEFTSTGGEAPAASDFEFIDISDEDAPFGLTPAGFSSRVVNADGSLDRRAGGHPFAVVTEFEINTRADSKGRILPSENVGSIHVDTPPGLTGNPLAAPQCDPSGIATEGPGCPIDTQIGTVQLNLVSNGAFYLHPTIPLYNMKPGEDEAAAFGFNFTAPIHFSVGVRTDGDHGLTVSLEGVSNAYGLIGSKVTLWGAPADPRHDRDRFRSGFGEWGTSASAPVRPFITNPSDCSPPTLTTTLSIASYVNPAARIGYSDTSPGVTECDRLTVEPEISVTPNPADAASPNGVGVDIHVPQDENPEGRGTPPLRSVRVALPEGMAISPSSANGLAACSAAQVHLGSKQDVDCPPASKIAGVRLETPILSQPMQGAIYVGAQQPSQLMPVYLVLRGPGMVIKLPGRIERDPQTGRVTTVFDETPQLPYEHLHMQFKTGDRAPLTNPDSCGTYTVEASILPWSGGAPIGASSTFQVSRGPNGGPCPNGGFDPRLSAGAKNPVGGSYSPFVLRLTREDGSQKLGSLDLSLPRGMLAKLAGVPYCPESALAGVRAVAGTGAAELASPACPVASRVGTVSVGAGAGPSPFYTPGAAYLAGPYKGAPLSLAVVTPAVAGPLDLGSVVVRNALHIDPVTTQVRVVSDRFPSILEGIPLNLRDVRVSLDRDRFTLNPTSCDPSSVAGTISSLGGKSAQVADRFQVGSCERLGFAPKLSFRFKGKTNRSAHPAVTATLKTREGRANIGKAVVTLPKTQFLAQGHIRTICTRVQYAADNCPKASVYGYAKAWTPLLDKPLQGPVYLRSSSNTLPDLVADLNGQIDIDLAGRIDSVDERMRVSFGAVPDAPVSKFVLRMQGGKKGLLVNNTELCEAKPRAKTVFTGHNGKRSVSNPLVKVGCGKGAGRRK